MLAAGHETSATSLTWALYHIHRDENVRGRVLEEPSGVATAQEMAGLPYLGSVIKETLRVHPTVSIVLRKLTGPLTVEGVPRAAGDVVESHCPHCISTPTCGPNPNL